MFAFLVVKTASSPLNTCASSYGFYKRIGLICPPLAHKIQGMEFIETPTFTRLLTALLTDDEYRELQNVLVENPARGDVIAGGGGKSGGVRVIYYWIRNDEQVYMLLIYPKSKKDNLNDRETALLREFVKDL